MIYALRWEGDEKITKLQDTLRECGVKQQGINLINYVLQIAGKTKRHGDLFGERNLLSRIGKGLNQVLRDVPNLYTQHQPYINTVVDSLLN